MNTTLSNKKAYQEMKYSNVLMLVSIVVTAIISVTLIKLFPKTGLSRIVFIPLLIGINLVLTSGINRILKTYFQLGIVFFSACPYMVH